MQNRLKNDDRLVFVASQIAQAQAGLRSFTHEQYDHFVADLLAKIGESILLDDTALQHLDRALRLVSGQAGSRHMTAVEAAALLKDTMMSLKQRSAQGVWPVVRGGPVPAVPIEESVQPDHIVCLEDGKKKKMLKRYLRVAHGMTPEEYRAKWGLPDDYPLVAPNMRRAAINQISARYPTQFGRSQEPSH